MYILFIINPFYLHDHMDRFCAMFLFDRLISLINCMSLWIDCFETGERKMINIFNMRTRKRYKIDSVFMMCGFLIPRLITLSDPKTWFCLQLLQKCYTLPPNSHLEVLDKFLDLPVFWWEISVGLWPSLNRLLLLFTLCRTLAEVVILLCLRRFGMFWAAGPHKKR